MERYPEIYEKLEEQVVDRCAEAHICYKDDGPEVESIRDSVYKKDLNYFIELLDPDWIPTNDPNELEDLLWEIGDEEFLHRYSLRSI